MNQGFPISWPSAQDGRDIHLFRQQQQRVFQGQSHAWGGGRRGVTSLSRVSGVVENPR